MKPKVYVTRLMPKPAMDRVETICDAKIWGQECPPPRGVLLENVAEIEGLISLLTDRVDTELMDRGKNLRVVSNLAVGFDNIDVAEATKRGIMVTNTPGVLTDTTADFAFALLMGAARRIVEGDKVVRAGQWKTWGPMILLGQDIFNATIGIIGFGRIGQGVARRAKGFGMRIFYYDITRQMNAEKEFGAEYVSLETLLAESDFVTIHTNLTEDTHHMIGHKQFDLMRKTSILVNTARGPIVDNLALYEALRDGKIAFAALDVTEPEPLPPDHQLLTLQNVIVTPHIASASVATRTKMAMITVDNLISGLKGERPPNIVNIEVLK